MTMNTERELEYLRSELSLALCENDALREALRAEHMLRMGDSPFKCVDPECHQFGKPLSMERRACACRDEPKREHNKLVQSLLA